MIKLIIVPDFEIQALQSFSLASSMEYIFLRFEGLIHNILSCGLGLDSIQKNERNNPILGENHIFACQEPALSTLFCVYANTRLCRESKVITNAHFPAQCAC